MRFEVYFFIFVGVIFNAIVVESAKDKKSTVAVPRKVKGNPISRSIIGTIFTRTFREMKVTFCSELEALTLQLTRPTDSPVYLKDLDELVRSLNAEYDNPQFTVGLLAKFSRKMCEPNVFTKLKSLICLHKMMQDCESNAQNAINQGVRSLKSEKDLKVNENFFSTERIEQASAATSNVAELEAVDLAIEYAAYVLEFVDFRGVIKNNSKGKNGKKEKGGEKDDAEDRADALLDLLEKSESVQKLCKKSKSGQVVKQCLSCVMDDRSYLIKQMQKLYETGLNNEEIEAELEEALKKWDPKHKNKTPTSNTKAFVGLKKIEKDEDSESDEIEGKKEKKEIEIKKPIISPVKIAPTSAIAPSLEQKQASTSVPSTASPSSLSSAFNIPKKDLDTTVTQKPPAAKAPESTPTPVTPSASTLAKRPIGPTSTSATPIKKTAPSTPQKETGSSLKNPSVLKKKSSKETPIKKTLSSDKKKKPSLTSKNSYSSKNDSKDNSKKSNNKTNNKSNKSSSNRVVSPKSSKKK